ncbi:phosphotransferase enzyme family domain-containing protein [Pochonia chlamydosporia 170]|uniref:Phosphotransferase enzyme family domain-containing protein n=1 Tax=Pochonia chlamydosporia 170 TaxID=1380566 RepID=A0A179FKH1_METCM|nr:phosphotransferase enzyme family domain-containing protein [Pochonia chlamydosporia 170]OAQ65543.1 phosphotransferase enzyme family domain-containing protein [Pochonia chlamydosporia 170]
MGRPNRTTLAWAATVLASDVTVDRGLREGGSPWLIQAAGNLKSAVLRVAPLSNAEQVRTEVIAMRHAATAGLPVPEVLGHNGGAATGFALVLTSYLAGSSQIPVELDNKRLRTLGATAARISAVDVPCPSLVTLPARTGPIEDVDWAALRRKHGASPMLRRAAEAIERAKPVDTKVGFVHGDLWHGNTLWDGTELTAILDWDAAGTGSPGIDLGSVRCDAALCYGPSAASAVLSGWEGEASRPAPDVAYWDVVAALASPPNMAWVRPAMADQGRPDLTAALLTERREEFLNQALRQLEQ